MKIKANLKDIQNDIEIAIKSIMLGVHSARANSARAHSPMTNIKDVYSCAEGLETIKLLTFTDTIKNFIIIEDNILTENDFSFITERSYMTNKKIERISKIDKTIKFNFFYKTELLNDELDDYGFYDIYNIYKEEPILIQNYKLTQKYNDIAKITNSEINSQTQAQIRKRIEDCSKNESDSVRAHFVKCAIQTNILDCIINCIKINPSVCGYDFIEIINFKTKTKTIYVLPIKQSKSSYIGNFLDLGKEHLPMLETIKQLYKTVENVCFLHRASVFPIFYCLHFHIVENTIYNSPNPDNIGTIKTQDLHIQSIINILSIEPNYFKNYNINFLLVN